MPEYDPACRSHPVTEQPPDFCPFDIKLFMGGRYQRIVVEYHNHQGGCYLFPNRYLKYPPFLTPAILGTRTSGLNK